MHNVSVFWEFEIFLIFEHSINLIISLKLSTKLCNQNIFLIPNWIELWGKFPFHRCKTCLGYSMFTILLDKVFSFKHTPQIPARKVLPVKAMNMYVFLCYLEIRKHFSHGHVSYKYYLLANWLAYLYGRISSQRPDVMPDQREGITWAAGFGFACTDTQAS